ncbi:unnamed protein product [Discula destructiva]
MGVMESGGASPFPQTATPQSGTANDIPFEQRKTKICVYCGSAAGKKPEHMEAARQLAKVMADNNIGLVYGGGTIGLMGEIAKTLVSLSGPDAVHGIIPEPLVRYERDPTYTSTAVGDGTTGTTTGLAIPEQSIFGRTTIVPDMHTRKRAMAQEVAAGGPGSGFIALPGGFGTMEELLEICTWNQLGIQNKGICVLNVNGFWDGLLGWIQKSVEEGFIRPGNEDILVSAATPEGAVKALAEYTVSDSVLKLKWGNE